MCPTAVLCMEHFPPRDEHDKNARKSKLTGLEKPNGILY